MKRNFPATLFSPYPSSLSHLAQPLYRRPVIPLISDTTDKLFFHASFPLVPPQYIISDFGNYNSSPL